MPSYILRQILKQNLDTELISKAFDFAEKAHSGQKRLSGENYIMHPVAVAKTLSEIQLDSPTIAAGLLHDVVDDTPYTIQNIEKTFGAEVAFLVNGVSKLGRLRIPKSGVRIKPVETRKDAPIDLEIENLRKMFFAMAEDIRVILIKLADRLHNMQTLGALPPQRQQRIALETLEIFAPLANRLGIGELKGQLEDLAFPHLYPKEFTWLMARVKTKYAEHIKYLENLKPILHELLKRNGIQPIDIHSRAKHYWSLYQKLLTHNMNLEQIYDLVALRVLLNTTEECYQALGVIHQHWKPLPGLIKDYIAFPKLNYYKSLHTTCFCVNGKLTEIQIKTPEMHNEAEYGIAAHWAYKEGIELKKAAYRKNFAWVQQLKDWQEKSDSKEFLEGLKIDFFKNRIFVFTPKGDVIDLPESATPVDFAYAVHTDVGNKCAGAKVNGKLVSLENQLVNGDVVEIIIDKNKKPSRTWLESVKTGAARSKVKEWLKKESRPENFRRGLAMLNQEFQQMHGVSFNGLSESRKELTIKQFGYNDFESFIIAVGEGEISAKTVFKSIFREEIWLTPPAQQIQIQTADIKNKKMSAEIALAGQTGLSINIAKCCLPQPGDRIIGYITKTKGASIHKEDCKNLLLVKEKWPQKFIDAAWQKIKTQKPYIVTLRISTHEDRMGLLRDITSAISTVQINIISCHTEVHNKEAPPTITLRIEISSLEELEKAFLQLKQVKGVKEIKKV